MFAIALWDRERRELLLARDRAGIKPLYYALVARRIVFGSEAKGATRASRGVARSNFVALNHYFSLKNIPAPASAYKAIRQLRPGELLRWRDGEAKIERWWRVQFRENCGLGEEEAAAHIRDILTDSVRLQMRSGRAGRRVPFGRNRCLERRRVDGPARRKERRNFHTHL